MKRVDLTGCRFGRLVALERSYKAGHSCFDCNCAKNDKSKDDFLAWVRRVSAHIGGGA